MSIFDYDDYKAFIGFQMKQNANVRGYKTQLAQAAGCQKSFFSHVHKSHVHLTPDHAAGLTAFLQLDELEADFFLVLVDMARAGTPRLKNQLVKRAQKIRDSFKNISGRVENSELQNGLIQSLYYSSWYWGAIHILTSIPHYQTAAKIAERLGLELGRVNETLRQLEKMGLLKKNKDRWQITDRSFHLHKDSAMTEMNHSNWRQRALIDVQRKNEESIHYTSVFSLSLKDAQKFQDMVTDFIVKTRKLIEPSLEEELFCLNADFFKV